MKWGKNLPLAHIEIRSNLLLLRAWLWSWPFLPSGNEEFYVKENAIEWANIQILKLKRWVFFLIY